MLHFGSPGFSSLDPVHGPTYHSSHTVVASHIQKRKSATDVSSETTFLKQKEEDWQQMLAQGQSSSPKIKRKKKNTNIPNVCMSYINDKAD